MRSSAFRTQTSRRDDVAVSSRRSSAPDQVNFIGKNVIALGYVPGVIVDMGPGEYYVLVEGLAKPVVFEAADLEFADAAQVGPQLGPQIGPQLGPQVGPQIGPGEKR